MAKLERGRTKIVFFGHFGADNFGNEATLQAMVWNVRRAIPSAELICVTTFPAKVTEDHGIAAIPVSDVIIRPWKTRNRVVRLARKMFVGVPSEAYRWLKAVQTLWHADMLVVAGTGLLTDSFCLGSWGPYSVFKWAVAAKLCRARLSFVSAGAGPLDTTIGRALIKSALSLADYRSFRDQATMEYLRNIGFFCDEDRVLPDLAFSLPAEALPQASPHRRPVVGVGLMDFAALYGVEKTTEAQYSTYIEVLLGFVRTLVDRGYDIRLLIGDKADQPTVTNLKSALTESSFVSDHIISEPVSSVESLLSQIAATDFVVATRFHNIVLSLLLNKPTIAISFHHKCSSLMDQMGLSDCCQDIQRLSSGRLFEQFDHLEKNGDALRAMIKTRVAECREKLGEQYNILLVKSSSQEPPEVSLDQETGREIARTSPGHD